MAIELAAARLKLLSPQAILDRLGSRLDFLTGGARDLPARHQTLRQAIAWSYDLLADDEKALFRRLATFTGGCTLEAVEKVSFPAGSPAVDALDGVAALVDKSLLRQEEAPGDQPRFAMLETIREYGLECLKAAGDRDAARRAHALYFLGLAEQAEPELTGPAQPRWLDRLEREHDNLRAALAWAEEQGEGEIALRLGAALWRFWIVRGHMREGRERLERLLALPCSAARTALRARALHGAGTIIHEISDYVEARPFLEESLAICRKLGDPRGTATALNSLGWLAFQLGSFEQARSLSEEALLLSREWGGKRGCSVALYNLGMVALHRSEYPLALSLLGESLALRQETGDRRGCAYVQVTLSWAECERGNHGWAAAILEEALSVLRDLDDRQLFGWASAFRGWVAHEMGNIDRARVELEASLSLAREVGNRTLIAYALTRLADVLHSQGEDGLALPLIEEGISLWGTASRWGLPIALHGRGCMALAAGDPERASALFHESLRIWSKLGTRRGVAESLEGLAGVALAQGDPGRAAQLYAAADAIRLAIGAPQPPRMRAAYEQDLTSLRRELGDDGFARAWAEGQALTPEQAASPPDSTRQIPS